MILTLIIAGICLTLLQLVCLRLLHRFAVGIFQRQLTSQEKKDYTKRDFRVYAVICIIANVCLVIYNVVTRH
jgi:hypothetical protein